MKGFTSGLESDRQRRILKDIQWAKRHKDLQELHDFKEKMRHGQETANKINELRRIEGYMAHSQPHSRLAYLRMRPDMEDHRKKLLQSIGLSSTPL